LYLITGLRIGEFNPKTGPTFHFNAELILFLIKVM